MDYFGTRKFARRGCNVWTMISVILLTRNRAEMLRRCLFTIFNQTYRDFEVLVFDHNSTDNTKEIVDKFPVRYFKEPEESSIPIMRNKGTREAKGDWICVMDDDDEMMSNRLEEQVKLINEADLIYSGWITQKNGIRTEEPMKEFSMQKLFYGSVFLHATLLIRKSWLEAYPYDETIKVASDWKMALTMAKNGARFKGVDKLLFLRNWHESNITHLTEERRITCEKIRKEFELNKVSVIIPYFNKKETLTELLNVLKQQDYKDFEIIVVDDGSAEKPSFDIPVKYFWHEDKGYRLNTIRNVGRRLATGDILVYLDADIIPIGNNFLTRLVKWHQLNPRSIATYQRIRKHPDGRLVPDNKQPQPRIWHNFSGGMFSIETSAFNQVGLWDEEYDGEYGWDDIDFAYRANKIAIPIIVEKSLEVYHIEHPAMNKPRLKNREIFYRKFGGDEPFNNPIPTPISIIKTGSPTFIRGVQVTK